MSPPQDTQDKRITLTVARDRLRLDRVVADGLGCGRRQARRLARHGRVLVNGRASSGCGPLTAGTIVVVEPEPAASPLPLFNLSNISICADPHAGFAAFNKPAGIHSHAGNSPESLAAALANADARYENASLRGEEGGLVHRLDRDTSGAIVAATTRGSYLHWRALFNERRVSKWYLALVAGRLDRHTTIEIPLARRKTGVVEARRRDRALAARTDIEPLESHNGWSLIQARMHTGVTHQVRAHLALHGHPILGDMKYGDSPSPRGTRHGQLLHAFRLRTDTGVDITAAVTGDFCAAYAALRCGVG